MIEKPKPEKTEQLEMPLFVAPEDSNEKGTEDQNVTILSQKVTKYLERYRPAESVDLVRFGTLLPRDLHEAFKVLCQRLHIPITAGTAKAMLYFILDHGDLIGDLKVNISILEDKKLDTQPVKAVSNSKPSRKVSNSLIYPAACPATGRGMKPDLCRKCSSSWLRVGCIYPEKAEKREKGYLRQHPMEAILKLSVVKGEEKR
jgi:hypothetical protein